MPPSGDASRTMVDATKQLVVPVGAALAIAFSLVSAHLWLSGQFATVQKQLDQVRVQLERLEERVADRWTEADQLRWSAELARQNPTLVVPPVGRGGRRQ